MSSDQALGRWQASVGSDAQQSGGESGELLRLKAGAPMGPVTSTGGSPSGKIVLLVDSNLRSRESRAKVMRTKGVHVDSVATADAARVRLATAKYNLVLVDLGRDVESAESLVNEIRANNSRQLVGFLVGSPLFIATSLSASNSRPHRTPAVPAAASRVEPSTPALNAIDFGQKIRDAEAKKIA
jgi:CheY-like chemotaxis protein